MREGRGPGDDSRAAVLYRVRHRPQPGEVDGPPAQLHPRLLPHGRQAAQPLALPHCQRLQEGLHIKRSLRIKVFTKDTYTFYT